MSETINLDWIGATLRTIQAEQRSIRDENALIRSAFGELATVLLQRIGTFEALIETRMDVLNVRIDGLHKAIDRLGDKGLGLKP
jgi:hypothetical protein